jgi:medium-chain acyl-[acyl-carrier-protein] hydrolase
MRRTLSPSPWVTFPKANPGARLRLFCFPYAGGGASIFRTWSDRLPSEIEVCPVQLPGRQSRMREPPFTQLSLLVERLSTALRPYLNVPFAFFGHSMGALISFELARQLRRQYQLCPLHLLVSSFRAPHIPDRFPPIHTLPEPAFIQALRRLNGIPLEILQNTEMMQLILPTLRADSALCEAYTYSPEYPLDCAISAFGGFQDYRVSYDELADWRGQTRSFFWLRMFPGGHFFLNSSRTLLLEAISQDLRWMLRR